MSVAFVLSGGASLGAVNAAWVAGDPTLADIDALAEIWMSLRTRDIFPLRPLTGLLGFAGRRSSLVSARGCGCSCRDTCDSTDWKTRPSRCA